MATYTCTIRHWQREAALFGGPGEPVAGFSYTVVVDVAEIPASLTLHFQARPTLAALRAAIAGELATRDAAPMRSFTIDVP